MGRAGAPQSDWRSRGHRGGTALDGRRGGWHGRSGWHGRGDRHWGGRFHHRHQQWHRGFATNVFVNQPWMWSPWGGGWGGLGGWGPQWGLGGLGGGWGLGGGLGGWGMGGGLGGWGMGGWSDWWGPAGYAPMAFETGYWNYMNPYFHEPLVVGQTVIDYSQPIILGDAPPLGDVDAADDDPAAAMAMARFNAARQAFHRGDYAAALEATHSALEHLPADAALHEFLALVHFAQGNYQAAAAAVHSVLAVGPGWSWETLHGLYPNVATYERHLRAAEAYRRANPESAYVRFLLGYHYLTTGYREQAARQFEQVLALEPNDPVAAQLLEGLTGERAQPPATPAPGPAAEPGAPAERPEAEARDARVPDAGFLVGSWSAAREDGSDFALTLDEEGRFTWTFTRGEQTSELAGTYTLTDGTLVLQSETSGAMAGEVSQVGENQLRFRLAGAPETDPGLTFEK